MRRLLKLGVGLVALGFVVVAADRVVQSSAYQARARAMRVRYGMDRQELEKIMAGFTRHSAYRWAKGDYEIAISYDVDGMTVEHGDPQLARVTGVMAYKNSKPTEADQLLELCGLMQAPLRVWLG